MMSSDGRLKKRLPHQVAPFVYTGVGIMKPDAFRTAPEGAFRLAPLLFDWAEQGRLFGVRLDGLWLHVGRPEAVSEAEREMARSML
jgi:MurNAc alpha-1-phosphate uridylyltransferase